MLKRCAVVLLTAALAVMGTAQPGLAATPQKGVYQQIRSDGTAKIVLNVDSHHKVMPEVYNKCVPVPVPLNLKVSSGKFSFHGTAKDVLGHAVKVDITGSFITKKVVVGKAHYRTAKCSATGFSYRAKYVAGSGKTLAR